jgi:hypothetical protein
MRTSPVHTSPPNFKTLSTQFDTFLCYNRCDKEFVKGIAEALKDREVRPWLDLWEGRPGLVWQRMLPKQIRTIPSAVVFAGPNGPGPWQKLEMEALLREFIRRKCPIIPVLMPSAKRIPALPMFLRGFTWVDFRDQDPDPMAHLIWGITGRRP